jgi:thioredoxin 1
VIPVDKKNKSKKNLALKIILPVILVVVIAGIWFFKVKGSSLKLFSPGTSQLSSQENQANPDFLLAATKADLEKLKSYGLPIIIDFGADECIPCKEMAPVLKKLNAEWQGKVIVKFVDVWKYPDAAAKVPLQVIPTQFFFDAQGKPYVPSDPDVMQMYMLKDIEGVHVFTAHQGGMKEEQIRAVFEEIGIK